MLFGDVNWIAVLVAGVAQMAIGAYWYSPAGFGKQWTKEMGFSNAKLKEMQQKMGANMYVIGLVLALVMAYVLAHVIRLAGATTVIEGAVTAFWVWLGFLMPLLAGSVLWEGKSQRLLTLNASYWLISTLVMGGILAVL